MYNYLKNKMMAFADIFKDKNDYNEKSIVGFASFAIMVIFAIVDLVTGYVGKDLVINEFIYNSFVILEDYLRLLIRIIIRWVHK